MLSLPSPAELPQEDYESRPEWHGRAIREARLRKLRESRAQLAEIRQEGHLHRAVDALVSVLEDMIERRS